ncbi:MAG TPA: NnrS family protein [Sphingomonadaceae bacterium]|nr:NnrS family protein [Sphingomonadaceae bacterium]
MHGSQPTRPVTAYPALFDGAFRPFFLAAAVWAASAIALWITMFRGVFRLAGPFDPLAWHIHEMLFGFVFAAIAGFLLTAIPNWTGRPPIRGLRLAALLLLWIAGRLVSTIALPIPFAAAVVIDLSFAVALAVVAAREVMLARNWRNLLVIMPVTLLGAANLLSWLEAGNLRPSGVAWRLGLAAILILVSVIASRIVPAFTRNWLSKRQGSMVMVAAPRLVDRLALGTLHAGLIGWVLFPESRLVGGVLVFAGAANALRLVHWRGIATGAEPLLLILHIGYLWVALGAALLGASMLTIAVPLAAAIHALTAGAIGTMIVAVMSRVSFGHSGRPLHADAMTTAIYAVIVAAGLTRVAAAFPGGLSAALLDISAALWSLGFLLFALRFAPILCTPRQ